jgi:Adenylate kinase
LPTQSIRGCPETKRRMYRNRGCWEKHSNMHKYIIMGTQGCGKGTQAKLLKEALDLVHISVGDIFRWHIQSHTKLGARIKRIVAEGKLAPDDIVEEVVKQRLEQHGDLRHSRTSEKTEFDHLGLDGIVSRQTGQRLIQRHKSLTPTGPFAHPVEQ